MAFTFIVEDGTVVTGANSYVTVERAADILSVEAYAEFATWDALELEEKQIRLCIATRWLEDHVFWKGALVSKTTQILGWPRKDAHDRNRNKLSQVVVPYEVERATALLAHHTLVHADDDDISIPGMRRFRADTFEIDLQVNYFKNSTPEFLRYVLMGLGSIMTEPGQKRILRA